MSLNNRINSSELEQFIKTKKLLEMIHNFEISQEFLYETTASFNYSVPTDFADLDMVVKGVKGKRKIGDYLYQLLDDKRKTLKDIQLRAGIKKEYWHKVTNGKIHPSKEKLLSLAVILKLNLEETEKLLRVAGYSFSEDLTIYEAIIGYFIKEEIYSFFEIDQQLMKYGEKTIFSSDT